MRTIFCKAVLITLFALTHTTHSIAQQSTNELIIKAEEAFKANNFTAAAENYNKAAFAFWENNNYNKALETFFKSLEINKKINNGNAVATIYNFIGDIYQEDNQHQKALDSYLSGYEYLKKMNEQNRIMMLEIKIADLLGVMHKYNDAVEHLEVARLIAYKVNNTVQLRIIYAALVRCYRALGNTKKEEEAYESFNYYDQITKKQEVDDVKRETESKLNSVVAEKDAKQRIINNQLQETSDSLSVERRLGQQKQMEIELLNRENAINELKLKTQTLKTRISLAVIALTLLFSFLMIRLYRSKSKINRQLIARNIEVNAQKVQIVAQSDKLIRQNELLNNSLHYAFRIQTAMHPLSEVMHQLFDFFIIYRPRDIVSGDFYWVSRLTIDGSDTIFVAVVDCTGHGVPGAFMSLIGNRLLNEIVNEKHITATNQILELLHKGVIESLHQERTEIDDGMDIALCKIEMMHNRKKRVSFSGAKRPLLVYRNSTKKVEIVKGDRRPIGKFSAPSVINSPFTTTELSLDTEDNIYLFSDGLTDQNNPERKRFGMNNLIQLIEQNGANTMLDQKKAIEKSFDIYRNNATQRDDITLLAINLTGSMSTKRERTISYNWSTKTILVVEDEEFSFLLIKGILETTAANLLRAYNGKNALDILQANPNIDLILTDLHMPEMDGITTIGKIRQVNKTVPIIVQTAFNTSDEKEKSFLAGCNDYITKPIQTKELLTAIASYM